MYGDHFFQQRHKKISRVVESGGFVNLIMRQPSAVNTISDNGSLANSKGEAIMMSQTHAVFTGQNHAQLMDSLAASDINEDQNSLGLKATIIEETDRTLKYDNQGASLHQAKGRANSRHHRFFSVDKDFSKTFGSPFFSGPSSPGNFLISDSRLPATNRLHANQEFFRATHSTHTSALKPSSGWDIEKLEQLPSEYLQVIACRQTTGLKGKAITQLPKDQRLLEHN